MKIEISDIEFLNLNFVVGWLKRQKHFLVVNEEFIDAYFSSFPTEI